MTDQERNEALAIERDYYHLPVSEAVMHSEEAAELVKTANPNTNWWVSYSEVTSRFTAFCEHRPAGEGWERAAA